jgi:hypothetical protein
MYSIFEKATVTIAAMDSPNSDGSCFLPDEARKFARIKYAGVGGRDDNIYVQLPRWEAPGEITNRPRRKSNDAVNILDKRWRTLQEFFCLQE